MPKKFCKHRWLENAPAAEQILCMWDDVVNYVKAVEKGKLNKPNCKSYQVVAKATKDILIPVKLNFFLSVLKIIQPFLTIYQRDSPMIPFLGDDLLRIALDCLRTFNVMKKEHESVLKNAYKLSVFDFTDKSTYSCISKVSLGFIGDKLLKELHFQNKVTERQVQEAKHQAQNFVYTFLYNLAMKSPIKYSLVRNLSCLSPIHMSSNSHACYTKLRNILSILTECRKLQVEDCDEVLLKFNEFLNTVSGNYLEFDISTSRIDNFFYNYMNNKKGYEKLWNMIRMLLVLSHGQAAVERGFSMNKHLEVENMKEETYVSKRLILDELKCSGDLKNFIITKELRISVSNARQKYMNYLEQQRKQKTEVESRKRKCFDNELCELKLKKSHLERSINELQKSADELCEKAEKTQSMKFVIQSNSFRKTVKEKVSELQIIEENIDNILHKLKKST